MCNGSTNTVASPHLLKNGLYACSGTGAYGSGEVNVDYAYSLTNPGVIEQILFQGTNDACPNRFSGYGITGTLSDVNNPVYAKGLLCWYTVAKQRYSATLWNTDDEFHLTITSTGDIVDCYRK